MSFGDGRDLASSLTGPLAFLQLRHFSVRHYIGAMTLDDLKVVCESEELAVARLIKWASLRPCVPAPMLTPSFYFQG